MLLDEPSLGLAPILVNGLFDSLRQLNTEGLPMILVEQNARAALSIAERACVLRQGAVTYDGDPGELASSEKLTSAYLSD
jgi:branched-chain amino acid transport system ATP-binding protein